jgi:putative FmdB family regulatory protein
VPTPDKGNRERWARWHPRPELEYPVRGRCAIPIYEYICERCGAGFEKLQFRRDENVACPQCGAAGATRQFSTFAFKGASGFVSSGARSCAGCTPGPAGCSGCGH